MTKTKTTASKAKTAKAKTEPKAEVIAAPVVEEAPKAPAVRHKVDGFSSAAVARFLADEHKLDAGQIHAGIQAVNGSAPSMGMLRTIVTNVRADKAKAFRPSPTKETLAIILTAAKALVTARVAAQKVEASAPAKSKAKVKTADKAEVAQAA